MASRTAKPGQTDQKKVYLNWANHYLRKSGTDSTPLTDLKEIADGKSLPRVLRAVVQEAVPGIHAVVTSDQERRENIDKCIEFLDKFGVNCSSFTAKDLCEGKDRAVLSLFYSLSQYKRTPPPNSNQATAKGSTLPSRIARPVSPGLKASHGVQPQANGNASPHPLGSPNPAHSSTPKEASLSVNSDLTPATSPLSPSAPHKSLGGPRRTAGSSIMTSTTFDRPYAQRKGAGAQKPLGEGVKSEEGAKTEPSLGEGVKQNGAPVSDSTSEPAEVKSDPETEGGSGHGNKPTRGSKLTKHSSFSFGHHSKETRLHKPGPSKGTGNAEEAESATPPTQTKLRSMSGSKLQGPVSRQTKEPPSPASSGDAPEESTTNEPHRPPSRLKFLGSGRNTPSNSAKSGIQRPSSRLSKKASNSTNNLLEGGGEAEDTPPSSAGGKGLKLQRKGSDGAVKRHLVNPSNLKAPAVQSGTSSLPRHLPKGTLAGHAHSEDPKESLSSSAEVTSTKTTPTGEQPGSTDKVKGQGVGEGVAPTGLRKPGLGGLKKPGSGFLSGSVRTPNLPSSGPQGSRTNEGEEPVQRDHTPPPTHVNAPSTGSPGLGGKRMLQQPKSGISKPSSLLKRPTSPSIKHKLHKVTPPAALPDHGSERKSGHTHPGVKEREAELSSSGSSVESSEGRRPPNSLENKGPHPLSSSVERGTSEGPRPPHTTESSESHHAPVSVKSEPKQAPPPQEQRPQNVTPAEPERKTPEPQDVSPDPAPHPPSLADSALQKTDTSKVGEAEVGGVSHLRIGRRVSPEGMSHEEITSPKAEGPKVSATPPHSPTEKQAPVQEDTESATSTDKEVSVTVESEQEQESPHSSRYRIAQSAMTSLSKVQRARSLSPKSPHRLIPKGVSRVRDLEGGVALIRANSSDSTSGSEGATPPHSKKPLKSSLRQKRGSPKSRHSSSSSMEGSTNSPARPKVTISPRSSQLVYDPEETGLHPPAPSHAHFPKFLSPGVASSERPSSFASIDSSTTSDSLSPSSSTHALFSGSRGGGGVVRRASVRSEQLDYRNEQQFLSAGLMAAPSELVSSTPELIESFENQLTNMKAELSDKDRMLSMYENSMADLSSKMQMLKKSLEEKDNAIRHLTEKQTWYDLESHSLMVSRAQSAMGGGAEDALSDGYLSDSMLEDGKEKSKKKKGWKNPFRSKKKDGSQVEQLSPNADTESVISSRTAKSMKRSFAKKKAPDLMSISEYPPMKDLDARSTFTVDVRSEYGGPGVMQFWEFEPVKVYDDPSPGAHAEVVLLIDTNETKTPAKSPANDSGYYGDLLSRHGNGSKWRPDSTASSTSSDSGNQNDDPNEQFVLGTLSVAPELSWVSMDSKVVEIFHHHLNSIDPEGSLGLSEDSIYCYVVGEERRQVGNALLPPVTPYQALANKLAIKIYMKGASQQTCDSLAYKTMMGTESLKSYMSMLQETQWLVVMGTKGTCKSSLVSGLAQHLSCCLEAEEGEGMEDLVMGVVGGEIMRFNLDKEGVATILKYFKTDLLKRVQLQLHPPIVVLEDVYECKDLEQLLVAASALSRRPYIIAALSSGTTKGIPLHQLLFHHQIRVVTCNPQTDPVAGILTRSLRKQIYQLKATAQSLDPVAECMVNWVPQLLDHLNSFINKFHSKVVNLGPRVLMNCPLNHSAQELENWFVSLWNHFIIPYLMGTIMAGIETYTADPLLEWVDVKEWVVENYPWSSSMNVGKLRTLNPDDVGWNHAVRPHQNRYFMYKDDRLDDTRSLLHADTQSIIH